MSKLVNEAAKFLSLNTSSKPLNENEDKWDGPAEPRKILNRLVGREEARDHIYSGSTKEGHHIYAYDGGDRGETTGFAVIHPDHKKVTNHYIENYAYEDGDATLRGLSKPADWHNVHTLHPSVLKKIHHAMKNPDDF